jgi:hypothetical protein
MARIAPIKFPAADDQWMLGRGGCAHDTVPLPSARQERFCCDGRCVQGRECPAVHPCITAPAGDGGSAQAGRSLLQTAAKLVFAMAIGALVARGFLALLAAAAH